MNNYIFKIITLYILLSLSLDATSLSHKEITKMVLKIKKERTGINLTTLESTLNPFAIIEIKKEKVEKKIQVNTPKVVQRVVVNHQLVAILNHAAFIDGKWYKVGDKIGIYKLSYIGVNRVRLKGQKESKQLVIPQREKKFKMFKGD